MNHQLETLRLLPVNKTVVFYSPIEGNDVLVRTGTIAEGSCFFHSLLHAYSKEYISMDIKVRMKFVKKLRSSSVWTFGCKPFFISRTRSVPPAIILALSLSPSNMSSASSKLFTV